MRVFSPGEKLELERSGGLAGMTLHASVPLAQLSPHKVPRRLWFVSELPRTELGKVQRSALSRLWQGRPDLSG